MSKAEALQRLIRPRSIALIGGAHCAEVIRRCRALGYDGALWPVHPQHAQLEGIAVAHSIAELPGPPDAAFVAVNRRASIEALRSLAARGAGGAVCYASGFAEAGDEGRALQSELAAAAGAMPYTGPNCHGFLNYLDGVALWPEQHGGRREARGIALVTQSGNIALNLTMQTRGVPIAYLITLGNQACVDLADVIEVLLQDARVTAIGLHIEGIRDPAAFLRVARRARDARIPLVAIRSGRHELSARLVRTHTASIAGADAVAVAFLRRAGVVCVDSLAELLETLKLVHVHGALAGRSIASLSCSGGEAGLVADAAARARLQFQPFTGKDEARVRAALPPLAHATNPLDYHNFNWGQPQALDAIYGAVLQAARALTVLVLDFPRNDRCRDAGYSLAADTFAGAAERTGARAAIVSSLPENLPEERARELLERGVAPLCGLLEAHAAIAAAAEMGELWRAPAPADVALLRPLTRDGRALSEWEAKRQLEAHGITVPRGQLASTVEEAIAAADQLGYPVVVKSVGATIAHKSELGAVQVNLTDRDAVRAAAHDQMRRLRAALLVESMVPDAVAELLVGVSADPVFGPYLVLGTGGTLVELLGDRRVLMLPASAEDIAAAIAELRAGRLLDGYRGRPPGDTAAAVEAVLAVQTLFVAEHERVLELEINPLLVRPRGRGAVAADALLRVSAEPESRSRP